MSGGYENAARENSATVGGGRENAARGYGATVGGGSNNAADGPGATVGGGSNNAAGGSCAMVPGGSNNAAGGSFSFAGGRRAKVRTADEVGGVDINGDEGTFVWADSADADFRSTGPDQFLIRAAGGVGIGTNSPSALLTVDDGVVDAPSDNSAGMKIKLWDSATTYKDYGIGINTSNFWILRGNGASFNIYENGSTPAADFTIDGSGRVGIGTTSPNYRLQVNGDICPEVHKGGDLGKSGLAWDDVYYDDLYNMGAAAFTDRIITEEILRHPPRAKKPGMFDYMTERGLEELDPASLPEDLHDQSSLLTDEIATYNYKANYEQQVQIDALRAENNKLKKRLEALEKIIQALEIKRGKEI